MVFIHFLEYPVIEFFAYFDSYIFFFLVIKIILYHEIFDFFLILAFLIFL